MPTLSQIMEKLRMKGITKEILMTENKKFVLRETDIFYKPDDLVIKKVYRFEGASDPDDNVALYLVQDKAGNKAMIIDSYGADSNYEGSEFDDFLKAISTEDTGEDEYDF